MTPKNRMSVNQGRYNMFDYEICQVIFDMLIIIMKSMINKCITLRNVS